MESRYETGKTYFVSCRTQGQKVVFGSAAMCVHMTQSMKYYRAHRSVRQGMLHEALYVKIIAYCLLPDQYVMLLEQVKDNGIDQFITRLHATVSRYYEALFKDIGSVFPADVVSAEILNTYEFLHASRYIHLLPFRKDMINDSDQYEYPWSSYHEIISEKSSDICNADSLLDLFPNIETFKEFTQTGQVSSFE